MKEVFKAYLSGSIKQNKANKTKQKSTIDKHKTNDSSGRIPALRHSHQQVQHQTAVSVRREQLFCLIEHCVVNSWKKN